MSIAAETHHVLLMIDPQTNYVKDYPPEKIQPTGYDFRLSDKVNIGAFDVPRKHSGSSQKAVIKPNPYRFLYLDVGVWAGDQMWFGVICGKNVWLCKFIFDKVQNNIPDEVWGGKRSKLLYKFWGYFADTNWFSFEVHSYAEMMDNIQNDEVLYVILPDMHMPQVPYSKKQPPKVTQEKDVEKGSVTEDGKTTKIYGDVIRIETYWRIENQADIFERAGEPLCAFLDLLGKMANEELKNKIKIIQVGDLYEMWQGMGVSHHFEEKESPHNLLVKQESIIKLRARILGIENQNKSVMQYFNNFPSGSICFLYGNHDVYLCEKVTSQEKIGWAKGKVHECWVKRHSTAVSAKVYGGGIIGEYSEEMHAISEAGETGDSTTWKNYQTGKFECWIRKNSGAIDARTYVDNGINGIIGVYQSESEALADNDEWRKILNRRIPRKTHFFENSIFIEHGHRMDDFNQDGKWAGPFITEMVYYSPFLRWLDPDRRDQYHRLTAIEYYYRKRFKHNIPYLPFSVFVMGHTHIPNLSIIEVYKKPGEIPGSFCLDCLPHDSEAYRRYKK